MFEPKPLSQADRAKKAKKAEQAKGGTSPQPILFTPGPVRLPAVVAASLANPPVNYHRQLGFEKMFAEAESDLKELLGIAKPQDYFVVQLTSTGTGANEACLLSMAGLGRGAIVNNGFFGARAAAQAAQAGLDHVVVELPSDRPIDVNELADALQTEPKVRWLFFVSHETRVGLENPLVEIGQWAAERGLFVTADVVSSAYAYRLELETAAIDLAVASSAKALMAAPGIGFVIARRRSMETLRKRAARSYYFDLVAEYDKQVQTAQTRFAQPVCLHAAVHAACSNLKRIGIDHHMARIQRQLSLIKSHLSGLGVESLLSANSAGIVANFRLPPTIRYPEFTEQMLKRGFYLLYGIPGDDSHFQVSTIGDLTDKHVEGLNAALSDVLA